MLPTKGGNPYVDNAERRGQKYLDQFVKDAFVLKRTDGKRIPRKRKKYIYKVERQNYKELLVSVIKELGERGNG